jgi:hypothetical protein
MLYLCHRSSNHNHMVITIISHVLTALAAVVCWQLFTDWLHLNNGSNL